MVAMAAMAAAEGPAGAALEGWREDNENSGNLRSAPYGSKSILSHE
jgi:hypothetical protein